MNWNSIKQNFEDDGALVDIYYEGMSDDRWVKLFSWLRAYENLESVNCYDPIKDQNLECIPETIQNILNQKGFYCFVSLQVKGISISFRFYEKTELECDVSPKEIDCEAKVNTLLNILACVQNVVSASRYIICPENCKKSAFNINGEFVS